MGYNVSTNALEREGINHDRDWTLLYQPNDPDRDYFKYREALYQWLSKDCEGRFHMFKRAIWFENETDAMVFALKWL